MRLALSLAVVLALSTAAFAADGVAPGHGGSPYRLESCLDERVVDNRVVTMLDCGATVPADRDHLFVALWGLPFDAHWTLVAYAPTGASVDGIVTVIHDPSVVIVGIRPEMLGMYRFVAVSEDGTVLGITTFTLIAPATIGP
jgi:hypothetical protein